jgi:DNA (cytosine-5)-methyltransferase 1
LVNHDGGETLHAMLGVLEEIGYSSYYDVLNAVDFGVPQRRERIYLVGFRELIYFEFPEGNSPPVPLGTVLETGVPDKYYLSDGCVEYFMDRKTENRRLGYGFGGGIADPASPGYALTVGGSGLEANLLLDRKGVRRLTPRECARMQGFPDTFVIPVSDTQAYKQFGNAVAVPVARAVARNLLRTLDRTGI